MQEYISIDDWDIQDREHAHDAKDNGPEQELISLDIVHPRREVALTARLHAEEASAHVDHLPGEEEGEPGQAGEGGGAGSEDEITVVVICIAGFAEIAVAEAV